MDWELILEGLGTIEKGMTQIEDGISDDCEGNEFTDLHWSLMQLWGQMMDIAYREEKFDNADKYPT
jgi:hypothetical protein